MSDTRITYVKVTFTEDDPYTFHVEPEMGYYPDEVAEVVTTHPQHKFGYSWPTHAEIHDDLAEAVKKVLDKMHAHDTGEKVER